jgi:hypothetical protein
MKITNSYGIVFDFDTVVYEMDEDILDDLRGKFNTEQELFDAYCAAHEAMFGEEFELDRDLPAR